MDCFGSPVFCSSCCRLEHARHPFHRVSEWNGFAFIRSALRYTGLVLYMGHGGLACPQYINANDGQASASTASTQPEAQPDGPEPPDDNASSDPLHRPDTPDSDNEYISFETGGLLHESDRFPKGSTGAGFQWMTIVDITGIHQIPVCFCSCDASIPPHIQLLRLGLYPVSHDRPRTVFTFRVLDDYHEDNLESKKAAQKYYNKLKRITDNAFTSEIPDRYRELMRVAREWRNIKLRQRAGVSHDNPETIPDGGLVPFCPACPQPDVNLPANWKEDPDQYVASSCSLRWLTALQVEIHANSSCRWQL